MGRDEQVIHARLCEALYQLAEDEPDLCRSFVEFLQEPQLFGRFTLHRGGMDISWEITKTIRKKKLTIR